MASKKIFSFAGTKCISVLLWVEETALTLLQDCFLGYFCLEQGSHHVLSSAYPSLPKSCHSLLLLAKLMDIMDVLTSFKVSKLSPMWSHGIFRLVEKRNPSPQPVVQCQLLVRSLLLKAITSLLFTQVRGCLTF